MLPKRTNRRSGEREYLLDVKLRTSQVRAARLRLLGRVLSLSFAILVVGFVSWRGGKFLLDHFFYESDAFAIRQIEVQTDGVVSAEALRNWASVKRGDNLLDMDLMRVKRDLEMQSCIRSVAVERLLPHTLRLRVKERAPVAQTKIFQPCKDGSYEPDVYQFDEEGYVMKPVDSKFLAQQPPVSSAPLPVLLGVRNAEVKSGRQVESPQIRAALRLIAGFQRSPMIGLVDLQRIDVTCPEVLVVTTSQPSEITFSLDQFEMQFRRWRLVYDKFQKLGAGIRSLDLSISNNLPVRLVAANTAQPMLPKASKPQRK